jgi:hypothetical protein
VRKADFVLQPHAARAAAFWERGPSEDLMMTGEHADQETQVACQGRYRVELPGLKRRATSANVVIVIEVVPVQAESVVSLQ